MRKLFFFFFWNIGENERLPVVKKDRFNTKKKIKRERERGREGGVLNGFL